MWIYVSEHFRIEKKTLWQKDILLCMGNVSVCYNVFKNCLLQMHLQVEKEMLLKYHKSSLSEEIYVAQVFLLLEGTKGYNLQRVIC